jgi:hypothetical protein
MTGQVRNRLVIFALRKSIAGAGYTKHMTGVPFNEGCETRFVLTTRSDGMITIDEQIGRGFFMTI